MHHRRALTLIEVLIVIVIIAILAALLLPVFARSKVEAMKTVSKSNLKQMHTSAILYGQDYDCFDDVPGLGPFPLEPISGNIFVLKSYGLLDSMLKSPLAAGSPEWQLSSTYSYMPPYPMEHPRYSGGQYGLFEKLQRDQQSYQAVQDTHLEWRRATGITPEERLKLVIPVISLTIGGSVKTTFENYMIQLPIED